MSHWKYTDTEYREDVGYVGILERDDKCVLLDVTYTQAVTYVGENMERRDTYAEHNIHGVNETGIVSYESVMLGKESDKLFRKGEFTTLDYLRNLVYG
jgi:hypothetical protein